MVSCVLIAYSGRQADVLTAKPHDSDSASEVTTLRRDIQIWGRFTKYLTTYRKIVLSLS